MWPNIENLLTNIQNQVRKLIKKIEKYPNLSINHQFEMVYKGEPQRRMNIMKLLLNHLSDCLQWLPGQDLFVNIATFNVNQIYFSHPIIYFNSIYRN